jgi:peptidoglycan/xylan/chitin deacetylase (PgdA/CDA1 family)
MFLLSLFLSLMSFAASIDPLEEYVSLHYKTEAVMREFDLEIEKENEPGILARSENYKDLLALRQLKEEIIHKLMDEENSLTFLNKVSNLPAADLWAADDLINSLNDHNSKLRLKQIFSSDKQREKFEKANVKKIEKRIEDAKRSDRHETQIRAMIRELGIEFEEQGTEIYPSPGANGNISGYNFPERTWALTYDDGPHGTHTNTILTNLTNYKVPATFFWLAQNIPANKSVVDRAKTLNVSLQNHSYTHANLPKISKSALEKEVISSSSLEETYYGAKPKFFRCPYGAGLNSSTVRKMIADQGMIHVFWNVDSLDWQDKKPASILARVKTQMKKEKKGVILFHDIHSQSVQASKDLMEYSANLPENQAIRWVTLPKIVNEINNRK